MLKSKKEELIEELKALRKEKDMTYQQIADRTAENGEAVSLSTIKLVFSETRNHDHDYNNILKPISKVLMRPSEEDSLEIKALQTQLDLSYEIINQLKARLDEKDQTYKELMNLYEQQQKEIEFKNEQIKHHNESIDRKDAAIRELYSILIGKKKIKDVFT